jgi:hypothetical protein
MHALGALVMPHAVILGAFVIFAIGPRGSNLRATASPSPKSHALPDSRLLVTKSPSSTAIAALQAAPPARGDLAGPKPPDEASPQMKRPPTAKKPGPVTKKSPARSARERSSAPAIQVKPVFFVPQGEAAPTAEQSRRLTDHLAWCQRRYREMLRDRDSFTLATADPLVYTSPTTLAGLRAAPESGVPRITGELLNATKFTRFDCPYVFVVVVMDPGGPLPDGEGRPFNGGFNLGGGVAVVSSSALDKLPNLQSKLQHELGRAFGLPHVNVYGHDMKTSASIMSHNPLHDSNGMQPSPVPGVLGPEDLRGLSFNRRAFPRLASVLARDFPAGAALAIVVPATPMSIDGQPAYELGVKTNSGEAWGTLVSNCVRNRIEPSGGGKFFANSMWQSAESPNGLVEVVVTFPISVELTAVGVHSQHSGRYNAADLLRVEMETKNGFRLVAESPLQAPDQLVPLPRTPSANIWRFWFHAENNKEVTLRGLQFFTRNGEIFPPPVPHDNDVGFL